MLQASLYTPGHISQTHDGIVLSHYCCSRAYFFPLPLFLLQIELLCSPTSCFEVYRGQYGNEKLEGTSLEFSVFKKGWGSRPF